MVSVQIWFIVLMTIVLGIAFPLLFFVSLKDLHLKNQAATTRLVSDFLAEYMETREKVVRLTAASSGIAQRAYFDSVLKQASGFTYLAIWSATPAKPIFVAPRETMDLFESKPAIAADVLSVWVDETEALVADGTNGVYVSGLIRDPVSGASCISLSTAIKNAEGGESGYVQGAFRLSYIESILSR